NLVERAMIRSNDGMLANPLPTDLTPLTMSEKKPTMTRPSQRTFKDFQREVILNELRASGWVIGGRCGAAARLGLKRTTLITKMKKLGISRPPRASEANEIAESEGSELTM